MDCKICGYDHTKKKVGPLTVCEKKAYFSMGAPKKDSSGKTYYAFGAGERFQHPGAK